MAHVGSAAHTVALLLFVLLPLAVLAAYLAAAALEREPRCWSRLRTASFVLGILLMLAAMSPPVAAWAHHDLRGHMVQHLALGMYAPIALVLGAPVTLLLRRLPARAGRRLVRFLETGPVRVLIHPVTAAVLDVGGMYLLYLTPLYAMSQDDPAVHLLMHIHFVVSGYLFSWAMIGPDPAPRRPGFSARLVVLLLAMAAHSMLAKAMYGYGYPRVPQAAIEDGAMLMYYGGDVAEIAIAIALFAAWFHRGARERRHELHLPRATIPSFPRSRREVRTDSPSRPSSVDSTTRQSHGSDMSAGSGPRLRAITNRSDTDSRA